MKNSTSLFLTAFILTLPFQTSHAEVEKTAVAPLPSLEDFTMGNDGWGFGIGVGVEYESAYEGSDEYGFEFDPAGAIQWRKGDNLFYWAGEALGWRGMYTNNWLFDIAVGFDEGRQESDSDEGHLAGLGDNDEGAELIMQTRYDFNTNWRYWLDGRIIAGNQGSLGLLSLGTRLGEQNDGSGHEVALAAVFHNSKLANTDFGVDSAQAIESGLNGITLGGGFRSFIFNYHYRHNINNSWQVFSEIFYERYSGKVINSPIARNNYEGEVGLGVIYVF